VAASAPDRAIKEVGSAFFALRVFSSHYRSRPFVRVALGFVLCGLFPVLCVLAAIKDDTMVLRDLNGGRGLLEHWGSLVQFIAVPAILFLTYLIVRRLSLAIGEYEINHLRNEIQTSASEAGHNTFVDNAIDILGCKKPPYQVILGLLMLIGLFSLVVNAQNTRSAVAVYGQDVWDSSDHALGYIAGRLFLGIEWIYIFPVVVYVSGAAFVVVGMLTRHILGSQQRAPSPYAPDGCGGFRVLGQVMLAFVFLDVPFACIVVAHVITHESFYLTLALAGVLFVAALCAQLFLPFIDLHRYLQTQKRMMLTLLAERIDDAQAALLASRVPENTVPDVQLTILALHGTYKQTRKLNTWPYLGSDVVKWASPLVPIVSAIVTKILLHALKVPA